MPTLSQILQQAISHHQAGQLPQAEALYRQILQLDSQNVDALHLLGVVAYQVNNYEVATQLIQMAIQLNPSAPEFYNNLGTVKDSQHQFAEAINCYQQAIRLRPDYAEAHQNLGNVFTTQNRFSEAIGCYQQAIQSQPVYPEAYNNLGNALKEQGQLEEAFACFQHALTLKPNSAEAYHNLGCLFLKQRKLADAETHLQRAVNLRPNFVEAYSNLGNVYLEQGQLDEAVQVLQEALRINPQFGQAHGILGNVLVKQKKLIEAKICYENALRLNPQDALTYNNLGNVYREQGFLEEAIDYYRHATTLQPALVEAHTNLGISLQNQGKLRDAIAHLRRVLEIKPDFAGVYSSLLLTLNYSVDDNPATVFAEHQRFNERYAKPLASVCNISYRIPAVNRGGRLRVGYVSSDFHRHSVAYFIEPILAHHNHQQFEIFCYHNNTLEDEVTQRIQGCADHFLVCPKLSDAELADRIRQDQIDILVDLMGHSGENRMLTFARKPAPISATYLGYPNTTGLTAIDYRLTDHYADPEGMTEAFHSETLVRLPQSFLCYRPFEDGPPLQSPPVTQTGYLTFGCFNNYAKVNPPLLRLWAQVLHAVERSKLMIKLKTLTDRGTRQILEAQMLQLGISPDRLILIGYTNTIFEHQSIYNDVDIALDPFPYCGTTTTCEALWMGVPVVTLVGKVHASRVGFSILSNVGLTELITHTPEDYVKTCIRLAHDRDYLQTFRKSIRTRMQQSPLLDAVARTRDLESVYRQWSGVK